MPAAVRSPLRTSETGRVRWSYVVRVRGCDGSFFPVSYFGGTALEVQEICQSLCPSATVAPYSLPFGGTIDEAVSINGEPYANCQRNKLARTFATQVEALKRYRSGGEQKMTVQHVHVAEGGQAIVGNVNAPTQGVGR